MARLRDPENGCPWDVEQTFETIAPYTIEESYEVADAIERADWEDLCGELGDLLLQVVYHAQMAREAGHFTFDDVVRTVTEKMVRRHPHVFGDATVDSSRAQSAAWEEQKARERHARTRANEAMPSLLDDVPQALPALLRALKLQARAARAGFDWPSADQVIAKLREELRELETEIRESGAHDHVREELGDLLFAAVNLARHVEVDAETALRAANGKFERRFRHIEKTLAASGRSVNDASLDEMEAIWQQAKHAV